MHIPSSQNMHKISQWVHRPGEVCEIHIRNLCSKESGGLKEDSICRNVFFYCLFPFLAIIFLLYFTLFLFDFFPSFSCSLSYLSPLLFFLSQSSTTPFLPWRSDKATITIPSPFLSHPSVSFLTS